MDDRPVSEDLHRNRIIFPKNEVKSRSLGKQLSHHPCPTLHLVQSRLYQTATQKNIIKKPIHESETTDDQRNRTRGTQNQVRLHINTQSLLFQEEESLVHSPHEEYQNKCGEEDENGQRPEQKYL